MSLGWQVWGSPKKANDDFSAPFVQVYGGFQSVTTIVAGACGDPYALGMGCQGQGQLCCGQAGFAHQWERAVALKLCF